MKSVLISILPRHCANIASGKKTVEVRKTKPWYDTPFRCYIYETKGKFVTFYHGTHKKYSYGRGKVIGEFVCDEIYEWKYECDGVDIDDETLLDTMLEWEEINVYAHGKTLYGWHILDLKIYDKPRELGEFRKRCASCGLAYSKYLARYMGCWDNCRKHITRPPQSWCYVEEPE